MKEMASCLGDSKGVLFVPVVEQIAVGDISVAAKSRRSFSALASGLF